MDMVEVVLLHVTQSFNFRYKLTKSINSCSTDIHFLRNNSKSVNMHCDYVFDCNGSRFLSFYVSQEWLDGSSSGRH
ncbi:hypothetical protein QQF64_027992 [Cirrhinus molitorella]|uniref:Uncharacterized protein n=1 Tax=Cirrhinus molitorella TaxID=172907 RepID=A0ABR3NDY0_9TELE